MLPKGRYIQRNRTDYFLIAILILLLLTLLFRGIGYVLRQEETPYYARVEFVIRHVSEEDGTALCRAGDPFYLSDGSLFAADYRAEMEPMTELIADEDGNLIEVESTLAYKVTFSFSAKGYLSEDGTFLFGGVRRLAMGETLFLSHGGATYRADVVHVRLGNTIS